MGFPSCIGAQLVSNKKLDRMLVFIKLSLLFSLSFSQISFAPLESDDLSCTTPHNRPGKCIGLRQCRNVLELLRRPIPQEVLWYIR